MAVPVDPQIRHIDGAPGSTSVLRGDRITMYVESLTGTLSGLEGGLGDADIDHAGQAGGELVIPGIRGYGAPR